MRITLTGEESLRLEPTPGPLTIESQSPDQSYSPFHMLGSALGEPDHDPMVPPAEGRKSATL